MGKYLDMIQQAESCAESAESAVSPSPLASQTFSRTSGVLAGCAESPAAVELKTLPRISRLSRTLSALESRCPDHVPVARWQAAVEDGRRFLTRWGEQAEALGWTARDLFGLHEPPENPRPTYQRLFRYDCTDLLWLLQGREVVALTETTAAIRGATGAITVYRRHNKPALGPLGDSLNDFDPPTAA
jgi:hypothetical protein